MSWTTVQKDIWQLRDDGTNTSKKKKTNQKLPQLIQYEMNNLNTLKYLMQINFQKILKARWFHGKILPRTYK